MGGKSSKPPLRRTKSFYNVGRSTQRMQFQRLKAQLNEISRRISTGAVASSGVAYPEVQQKLESIRRELDATSENLKEHNKPQYEQTLKLLDTVSQLFHELPGPISLVQSVNEETTLNQVNENPEQELGVELRKSVSECSDVERTGSVREKSSIKFGIQVMPLHSPVSQDLLKRSTLPTNSSAKAELENIRNTVPEVTVPNLSNNNEKVRDNLNLTRGDLSVSTEFLNFIKNPLVETEIQTSAIKKIESIGNHIAELENEVLYFKGKKGGEKYFELHELFVRYLIELDSIEAYGNPIIRQDKRTIINRIQELLAIFKKVTDEGYDEVHF